MVKGKWWQGDSALQCHSSKWLNPLDPKIGLSITSEKSEVTPPQGREALHAGRSLHAAPVLIRPSASHLEVRPGVQLQAGGLSCEVERGEEGQAGPWGQRLVLRQLYPAVAHGIATPPGSAM